MKCTQNMRAFRYEDTSIYSLYISAYMVILIYIPMYLYMYICVYIDIATCLPIAYRFASVAFKSYISPAPIISTISTSFACDLTKSIVDCLSFAR